MDKQLTREEKPKNVTDIKTHLNNVKKSLQQYVPDNMKDAYTNFFSNMASAPSPSGTIGDAYTNLFGSLGGTFFNKLLFSYLTFINGVLQMFYNQLDNLIPSGEDVADTIKLQNSLANKLEKKLQNPEFQRQIRELTKQIAILLNAMLNEILTLVDEEGEEVIQKIGKVTNKMATNLAATGVDTIQDALSVIPGLDMVIALFTLATSSVTNVANTFNVMVTMFTSTMDLMGKLMGRTEDETGQIMDVISKFKGLLDGPTGMIEDTTNKLNKYNKIPSMETMEPPNRNVLNVTQPVVRNQQTQKQQNQTQTQKQTQKQTQSKRRNQNKRGGTRRRKRTKK